MGFGEEGGMLAHVLAPKSTHNRNIFQQNSVDLNRGYAAAREADDQEPAFRGDAFGREIENIASDRIVNHVGAAAAGDLVHAIYPARIVVIEGMLRALRPAEVELRG